MKLGVTLRLMGAGSEGETLVECATAAEQAQLDDLFVPDHIAIAPDDAEGSNGRYLDALASLAYLAGVTEHIGLGTGVLILPYRRALPTAKWISTIQELSGGRLLLGVGIGWMDAEFRALGLDRRNRGRDSDRTLDLLRRCFEAPDDVVHEHGQPFLFRPHPPTPPIFVGGSGDHALRRAARYGDGWMPMAADPEKLAPEIARLREMCAAAQRPEPEVVCFGGVDQRDPARSAENLARLRSIGVTRFVAGARYANASEFRAHLDVVVSVREQLDAR
jgi:probable F420-dependent oxidoreductase